MHEGKPTIDVDAEVIDVDVPSGWFLENPPYLIPNEADNRWRLIHEGHVRRGCLGNVNDFCPAIPGQGRDLGEVFVDPKGELAALAWKMDHCDPLWFKVSFRESEVMDQHRLKQSVLLSLGLGAR